MKSALNGELVTVVPMEHAHIRPLLDATAQAGESFRFTLVPTDLPGMTAYVDQALIDRDAGVGMPWVLVDRDGIVVGSSRFRCIEHWPVTEVRPELTVAEIGGTWLATTAQGTGINVEAKLLMLDYAFSEMGAFRISLMSDARNARSRRAIERIGADFDGILRAHMPAFDGGVRDSAFYSILAENWQELRGPLLHRIRRRQADPI